MIVLLKFAVMKNNLENARRKIDAIDDELIKLFLERLAVSREVALAKKETNGAVVDPMREREILTKISVAAGAENENAARMFFTNIFSISKARQRSILKGPSPLLAEIDLSSAQTEPFPSRAAARKARTHSRQFRKWSRSLQSYISRNLKKFLKLLRRAFVRMEFCRSRILLQVQ